MVTGPFVVQGRPGLAALFRLLVVTIPLAWLVRASTAQGDPRRFFPDEVTVADLEFYGRLLNLSDAQSVAVQEFHRTYLQRFAELYEEKIESHGWPTERPDTVARWLAVLERHWSDTEAIRNQIRRVDAALFDEIQGILDDSQLPAMQRVRDHRERRTLYIATVLAVTQRQFHDLSALAHDLDLSPSDAERVELVLPDYERRLTALCKRLHDEYHVMELEPRREMVRRGHGDEALNSVSQDLWRQVDDETWQTRGRRTIELAKDIDALNQSTTDRIVGMLSIDGGHKWMEAFLARFYQSAGRPRQQRRILLDAFERASSHMLDADKETFLALFAEYESSLFELERRLIEAEGAYRNRRSFAVLPNEPDGARDRFLEVNSEVGQELRDQQESFRKHLEASLSPGAFELYAGAYAVLTERKSSRPTHPDGSNVYSVGWASLFLEPRDLGRMARVFGLNDEQQEALRESFETYSRARAAIEKDVPVSPPDKFHVRAPITADLRSRIRRADESVFANIDAMLESEGDRRWLKWLRNARERKLLGHICAADAGGGIDVSLFVLDCALPIDDLDQIADLLDEYDSLAAPLYERLQAAYDTHYEWYLAQEERTYVYPHVRAWQDAQVAVAKLNVDTMRDVEGALSSDASARMIELFERHCYGPIFQDESRAHPLLSRAKRIGDLSAEQQAALLDLEVAFLDDYDRLTAAMLDDVRYTRGWHVDPLDRQGRLPSDRDGAEAYARHRFERDELSAATAVKLKTILTEAQLESIGGLPDLK